MHSEDKLQRVLPLDGLRGISIIFVMAGHLFGSLDSLARLGVTIFFFISGYIITTLLVEEEQRGGSIRIGQFYLRRYFRLYPVIVVYLLVIVAYKYVINHGPISPGEIASVLLYYVNYYLTFSDLSGGKELSLPIKHFWSLAVEKHFYIVFPLVIRLTRRHPERRIVCVATACLICLLIRIGYVLAYPDQLDGVIIYRDSETRFDSIAFGCMLALLARLGWQQNHLKPLIGSAKTHGSIAILLLTVLIPKQTFAGEVLLFTFQGALLFVLGCNLFLSPTTGPWTRILASPLLVFVGILSYSFYVWHALAVDIFYVDMRVPYVTSKVAAIAATIIFGLVSYYAVERPFLRVRHYFGSRATR